MSGAREPLRRIVIAGGGQVGVLAAIGLKRTLPQAEVLVLGFAPDRAAFADHAATALPFTNHLHDRLGIEEARIVGSAGGSHRLVVRYAGWAGDGRQRAMSYGADRDPALRTAFARDWDGGPRNTSTERSSGSLAEVLAEAGQFAAPSSDAPPALAEIDYALRWNPRAYRDLLIASASRIGVAHRQATITGAEPDGEGGLAALIVDGGIRIAADLFVDCSGPAAMLLSSLPAHRDISWGTVSPVCKILLGKPGAPVLALEDRFTLVDQGWRGELPGRDGLHVTFGLVPGVSEAAALRALGAEPLVALPLQPGRAATPWLGNVVALGDAAAWFEPLAFLNLDLAHRQLDLLLEMLPGRAIEPLERAEYNRRSGLMMDSVRDTLAAHYAAPGARKRFIGAAALSPELAAAIDQFTRRGRMPFREEAPLHAPEFRALLAALGFDQGLPPQAMALGSTAGDAARRSFDETARALRSQVPRYDEWMAAMLSGG